MLRPLRALLVALVLGSPVVGRAQDATPVIELELGVTYGEANGGAFAARRVPSPGWG